MDLKNGTQKSKELTSLAKTQFSSTINPILKVALVLTIFPVCLITTGKTVKNKGCFEYWSWGKRYKIHSIAFYWTPRTVLKLKLIQCLPFRTKTLESHIPFKQILNISCTQIVPLCESLASWTHRGTTS